MNSSQPNGKFWLAGKSGAGFTLIELIITVGVIAIVAAVGIVSISGKRDAENLRRTLDEIVAIVDATRQRSVTQEGGSQWGIRFSAATSSSPQSYSVFRGASYASGVLDRLYTLGRGAQFTEPAGSSAYELTFSTGAGTPNSAKVVSLSFPGSRGLVADLAVAAVGRVSAAVMEDMVGYWHFDEGSGGAVNDASGNGSSGALVANPVWQSGSSCRSGSCLAFDKSPWRHVLVAGDALNAHTALTIAAWVYPTGTGGSNDMGIIVAGETPSYYLAFNDSLQSSGCYWYGTTPAGYHSTPAGSVPMGQWSHLACVWDGSAVRAYVNGALRYTASVTGAGADTASARIGAENANTQFQGTIDEVKVFSRALSAAEIMGQYQQLR